MFQRLLVPMAFKKPRDLVAFKRYKNKFELSVICKFRGHVFNTLWKVRSVCKCAYLLLPRICILPESGGFVHSAFRKTQMHSKDSKNLRGWMNERKKLKEGPAVVML